MKNLLMLMLCSASVLSAAVAVEDQMSDEELWNHADYYFIRRPNEEKKSSFNAFARTLGWTLRMATAGAAGAAVGYKAREFIRPIDGSQKDWQSYVHTTIDWTRWGLNLATKLTAGKALGWSGIALPHSDLVRDGKLFNANNTVTPDLIKGGLWLGAGGATTVLTYKILGSLCAGFNRNRTIDLSTMYGALKNVTNRDFATSMPAGIRRSLRMALGEGNNLTDDAALVLLEKIREQIEDHISRGHFITEISTQSARPMRTTEVVVR